MWRRVVLYVGRNIYEETAAYIFHPEDENRSLDERLRLSAELCGIAPYMTIFRSLSGK